MEDKITRVIHAHASGCNITAGWRTLAGIPPLHSTAQLGNEVYEVLLLSAAHHKQLDTRLVSMDPSPTYGAGITATTLLNNKKNSSADTLKEHRRKGSSGLQGFYLKACVQQQL